MSTGKHLVLGALAALLSSTVLAQQPIYYPAKGQSAEQQQKDTGDCQGWATQNTGISPASVAQQAPPPSGSTVGSGDRLKGAAGGALGGLAIGAIAGGAGEGAAIGAIVGTMAGGRRARKEQKAEQQQYQAEQQQQIQTWNNAVGACMSGRGYTVG